MSTNTLIQALQHPHLYDHPIKHFQVLETHGAWVLLTGNFAYKIKKPVDFEFLNYSTLAKRKFYCEEEVRLNQRLAAVLYLGVIPITGSPENPVLNGSGPVIEYAIKMCEFPQSNLFSNLIQDGGVTPTLIDELAVITANFHTTLPTQNVDNIQAPVQQNFDQIRPMITEHTQLDRLETWAKTTYQKLKPVFEHRKQNGFVRECHGDLYLKNIILWDGHPLVFDCIEFNEEFRWTDTMADVGFLAMDLEDNGRADYAHRLINQYMETSGDYNGLAVLRFYQSYRAVVRAKIALFQSNPAEYTRYINLAESYTKPIQPELIITYGVSGSGKSTRAKQLVEKLGVIQIRSDIERKRLLGLTSDSKTNSAVNQGIYSEELNQKTYQRLRELAKNILESGYSVIVDAAFLKQAQRELFAQLAKTQKISFKIIVCKVPETELKTRILSRTTDPSEARLDVLSMQLEAIEKLTNEESRAILND